MSEINKKIEDLFNDSIDMFDAGMSRIDVLCQQKGLNDDIQQQLNRNISSLSEKCGELEQYLKDNRAEEELPRYMEIFRKRTFKWLLRSYCIRRSFEKPRGYAGDYDVIDRIYLNRPVGEGIDLALDRYYLDNKGAEAMRSRKSFLVEKISAWINSVRGERSEDLSLFDLGCGPGRDVLEIFGRAIPLKTKLVDQDVEALNYCRKVLGPYSGKIEFIQNNLLRIIAGEKYVARKFGVHDLVMCIGLYDYFDEDASVKLLRSSYNLIKKPGMLVISNWNVTNPSKTEMEWICSWYVYHRTKQEMARIIERAGIPSKDVALEYDPTGHFHIAFIYKR